MYQLEVTKPFEIAYNSHFGKLHIGMHYTCYDIAMDVNDSQVVQ